MTDLISRLRGWKHAAMRRDGSTLDVMREAADEIEKLKRSCDIAWAAGLFEGEGAICGNQKFKSTLNADSLRRKSGFKWELIMHSTDHDVLRRFAAIVEGGTFQGPYPDKRGTHYKPQLRWYVGNLEDCQRILRLMLPYLGTRRSEKARQCLEAQYVRKRKT